MPAAGREGAQQADPGALAAGKGRRIAGVEVCQPGRFKSLFYRVAPRASGNVRRQRQHQVLPHAEGVKQQGVLKQNADPARFHGEQIAASIVQPQLAVRLKISG